jgi:hypothetical protein
MNMNESKITSVLWKYLSSEVSLYVCSILSCINYYVVMIIVAVWIDVSNALSGGPMTMIIGLGMGAPVSILLAVVTHVVQYYLLKSNNIMSLRVVSLFHYFLFVVIVVFSMGIKL